MLLRPAFAKAGFAGHLLLWRAHNQASKRRGGPYVDALATLATGVEFKPAAAWQTILSC